MKLFINDWDGNPHSFTRDLEENKEYPVNNWVSLPGGKRIYLASLYVYDEFIMFFYICALDLMREYMEHSTYVEPKTNRDWAKQPRGGKTFSSFEYEVNHLKSKRHNSGACLPTYAQSNISEEEMEYDYLHGLMKERLPQELQGLTLAFRKDCCSFEKAVNEVEHISIFPSGHEINYHFIDKTFTLPFGNNKLKIEYPIGETQASLIIQELKLYNMLEAFESQYDELEKANKEALQDWEKRGSPANEEPINLDELREMYDKKLLLLSYLVAEEYRSFEFYLKEYLDAEVTNSNPLKYWLYIAGENDKQVDGLYKRDKVLCEVDDVVEREYEITLMWAVDSIKHEKRALFEMSL